MQLYFSPVTSISLVIPAYNEETGLRPTVERCQKVLQACTGEYEILIVDDASRDATPSIMRALQAEDPQHIRTYFHRMNQGIASTFEELYKRASKEYVFLIPADGEFPPEALLQCMQFIPQYDIVICQRIHKKYTLYRLFISGVYRWLTYLLFGIDLFDPGSIKLVKRALFTSIPVQSTSVYVEAERIVRAVRRGHSIERIIIPHESRKGGKARGAKLPTLYAATKDCLRLWLELRVLRKPA